MAESQFSPDGMMISLDNLDSYLEMLYEDAMEDKIKATFMILQLVRDPDNLEVLVENEQFLGALTRIFRYAPPPPCVELCKARGPGAVQLGSSRHGVCRFGGKQSGGGGKADEKELSEFVLNDASLLREEAKKSMDLVINVVYIFFAFSNFSAFHKYMTQYKVVYNKRLCTSARALAPMRAPYASASRCILNIDPTGGRHGDACRRARSQERLAQKGGAREEVERVDRCGPGDPDEEDQDHREEAGGASLPLSWPVINAPRGCDGRG